MKYWGKIGAVFYDKGIFPHKINSKPHCMVEYVLKFKLSIIFSYYMLVAAVLGINFNDQQETHYPNFLSFMVVWDSYLCHKT